MKSAYVTLGIPGNAGLEDIQEAYQRALGHFTKEKLAADPSLFSRVEEIKEAFKVLSNPDLRRAHDRKITGYAAPAKARYVAPASESVASSGSLSKWLALGALVVFGAWYLSHQHEEAKLAKAATEARELAQKKEAEAKAEQAEKDAAAAAQAKIAATNAQAARNEQQLRYESARIGQQVQAAEITQQNIKAARERQEKNDAYSDKQRAATAAAQRAAIDQRALRDLCIINTGRPYC